MSSETARQRFLREARAAASLRHPNVATVFHLGNSDGRFFYAMEYVEGETVERRVQREGPLPADLALRITRQVTRALISADRQKLVHRDIKPSNIMLVLDADEDHLLVKVIDFGLAKSLGSALDQSVTISMGDLSARRISPVRNNSRKKRSIFAQISTPLAQCSRAGLPFKGPWPV